MMNNENVTIVNKGERLRAGFKDALFSRVCNKYTCELIPLNVETHGISKNKLIITGLAITHRPRTGIYIPKETFEKYGSTLVGKPLADGHGSFPWSDITVDEILGVVTEEWYDEKYEAQMFKAEVWDEKAVQVLKSGMYNKFSVAYYYNYNYGTIVNEYDEEEEVVVVTELDYDHIAFLNSPQVPEAEVKEIEELSCQEPQYMDAEIFSGDNLDYLAKTYRHNSIIKDDEPSWGSVDKTRLPWNAFANWDTIDKDKKSTWKYPHHWISMGKMYLHRGGLIYALAAAKGARSGKKAPKEVFTHLNKHVKAIKLSADDMKEGLTSLGLEDSAIEDIIAELYQETRGIDMSDEEKDKDNSTEEEVEDTEVEEKNQQQEEDQTAEEQTEEETDQDSQQEEDAEEVEVEDEEVEETESDETEQLDEDSSAVEKIAQMSVQLNEKDKEIANLKDMVSKYEEEKLEQEIEKRVAELLKDGKITPAKKDETIALYKSMQEEQWENFEKIIETNSSVPIKHEKGRMGYVESEKDSEGTEEKGFFN